MDLPDGIGMAWKNFYDEDTPTFTQKKRWLLIQSPGSFPISDCALKGMLLFCGTSSHRTINGGILSL